MKTRIMLKIAHPNINISKILKYHSRIFLCIAIIFVLLLCSCQKQPSITIHVGKSDSRYTFADLKVVDGKYQEALDYCQEKLQQVETDSVEEADIYNAMGGIYAEYLLDQENTLFYLNKAMEIHQKKEDEMGLALDYTVMSYIYIYIGGDTSIGMSYLEKAEKIYRKHNYDDSLGLAGVLINKGRLYIKNAQYEGALDALINAQTICDKRQEKVISIYLLKGQAYLEMKEYELSEAQYLKALQISETEGNEYNISRVNYQIAWLYGNMKKYDMAIKHYNQTLNFVQSSEIYLSTQASVYI